ncbi:MAG: hypothetical protein KGK07_13485 [Chloroflexota bacterium]|nr:hypothetical protein [Chloroflexota bacterium]
MHPMIADRIGRPDLAAQSPYGPPTGTGTGGQIGISGSLGIGASGTTGLVLLLIVAAGLTAFSWWTRR